MGAIECIWDGEPDFTSRSSLGERCGLAAQFKGHAFPPPMTSSSMIRPILPASILRLRWLPGSLVHLWSLPTTVFSVLYAAMIEDHLKFPYPPFPHPLV